METKQKLLRCLEPVSTMFTHHKKYFVKNWARDVTILKVTAMDFKCLQDNHERLIKIKARDKQSCKLIKNIQDLDVSMRELEQNLKMIRAEMLDFQLKNCEELKIKLSTETSESETLVKNTQRFLELFAAEEKNQEPFDKSYVTYKKHIPCPKLHEKTEGQDKQRLHFLTSEASDCGNERNFVQNESIVHVPIELNSYSIDASSKKMLKQLEDQLEKLDRRK